MFYKNILHCNEVNVMGFLNILEAARINKVNKVVYASTSSIYGANKMPFTENKIDLTTFYPITKYVNELYAKQYTKEGWLDTTGCRFFSVYGPHEKGKKDFANFLTQSIWNMSNDKPAIVFGDGKQTRDFIFVRDICRGLIACMKCKEASGKIINIGTGIETNILDMIDLINKALNTDIKPLYVPNPIRGYVKYTKSDTSLMDSLLKFKPSVKIEDGIKITAQFYNNEKKEKIRIAFVKYAGLAIGGSELWLQKLAVNLPKNKYEVDYYYCDSAPFLGSNIKQKYKPR
jgi:UDP-glucose 4-epimerase